VSGGRAPAQERLARLLAIVPWVASHDGPRVEDVCRRFGVDERELLADLDLLFVCGVYPFTPDTLIEVDVADGRVWIRFADYFRAPLRLTPPEGLALLAGASAMLATPGADPDGALARAVGKLSTVVGVGTDEATFDLELGPVDRPVLDAARRAAEGGRRLAIDYYSFGRDGYSSRVIHPWHVFNVGGQWYVRGWCERAVAERLFRVDRITTATEEDGPARPAPPEARSSQVFAGSSDLPLVVLDLLPGAHWIAEQYPNEGVERLDGDVLRVRLRSASEAWLERLLLRAGRSATVVEGDAGLRRRVADRVLRRYRRSAGAAGDRP
jgi:proteasome accessory factor C